MAFFDKLLVKQYHKGISTYMVMIETLDSKNPILSTIREDKINENIAEFDLFSMKFINETATDILNILEGFHQDFDLKVRF